MQTQTAAFHGWLTEIQTSLATLVEIDFQAVLAEIETFAFPQTAEPLNLSDAFERFQTVVIPKLQALTTEDIYSVIPTSFLAEAATRSKTIVTAISELRQGTDQRGNFIGQSEALHTVLWGLPLAEAPPSAAEVAEVKRHSKELIADAKQTNTLIRQQLAKANALGITVDQIKETFADLSTALGEIEEVRKKQNEAAAEMEEKRLGLTTILTEAEEKLEKLLKEHRDSREAESQTWETEREAIAKQWSDGGIEARSDQARLLQEIKANADSSIATVVAQATANVTQLDADLKAQSGALLAEMQTSMTNAQTTSAQVAAKWEEIQALAIQIQTSRTNSGASEQALAELVAKGEAFQKTIRDSVSKSEEAVSNADKTSTRITKDAEDLVSKVELALANALGALKDNGNETIKTHIETLNSERQGRLDQLDEAQKLLDHLLTGAQGYKLSDSFTKRQKDIGRGAKHWRFATIAVSAGSAFGLLFVALWFSSPDYKVWLLRFSFAPFLAFAIGFCVNQYTKERRLEEEYAFKSNVSIALEAYRNLVGEVLAEQYTSENSKAHEDYAKFLITAITDVLKSPVALQPGRESLTRSGMKVTKEAKDMVKEVAGLVKTLKDL